MVALFAVPHHGRRLPLYTVPMVPSAKEGRSRVANGL
jgi:hypothetical protein